MQQLIPKASIRFQSTNQVGKLRGELSDLLLFSGIDAIADKSDKIVTEVTALAKIREKDILE